MKTMQRPNRAFYAILGIVLCFLSFNSYRYFQNKWLMDAIYAKENEQALTRLRRGADPNYFRIQQGDDMSRVYVLPAAIYAEGSLSLVKELLERGASLNPPLSHLGSPLNRAISANRADILRLLLEKGAHAGDQETGVIRQALSSPECYRLLRQYGYSATLIDAGHVGDVGDVLALLDRGADINQQNKFGETPLIMAVQNRHADCVKLLIARGADVNLEGQYGSPLYLALHNGSQELAGAMIVPSKPGAPIQMMQVYGKRVASEPDPSIIAMLKARGAHLNLAESIRSKDVQAVRDRIREGTDVNRVPLDQVAGPGQDRVAKQAPQRAPLFLAIAARSPEIVRLLLDAGANPNLKTANGQTPLMWGAASGSPEIVRLLLAKGADASARDARGKTALKLTNQDGNHDLPVQNAGWVTDPITTLDTEIAVMIHESASAEIIAMLRQAGAEK